MNDERLGKLMEDMMVKFITSGEVLKVGYDNRIEIGPFFKEVYGKLDFESLAAKVRDLLEIQIAEKIVDMISTEMSNDIKKLLSNATIRDDVKFTIRQNVEFMLKKLQEEGKV